MIKITYTITFTEPGGAAACLNLPPELEMKFSEFRVLAADLGCMITFAMDENMTVVTVDHLWPEQSLLDLFLEQVTDYQNVMQSYETYIAGLNGTILRTQEEI